MSTLPAREPRGPGCWAALAWWFVPELAWLILVGLFGSKGSAWLVGGSLAIAFFAFIAYATLRVLRGHDL